MNVSDTQKLKWLEDENRRLLAESMLDVAALKDASGQVLMRSVAMEPRPTRRLRTAA